MTSFEDMEATLRGGGVKAVSAPQLFPTPFELALRMTQGIEPGATVLEPSAGTGALLAALPEGCRTTAVEINRELADGLKADRVVCADFLECWPDDLGTFDVVLANPPFAKDQDIRHIWHMWQFVKPGGRLVTLSGAGWTFGTRSVCEGFRAWVEEVGAEIEDLPPESFRASGTMVNAVLIRATTLEGVERLIAAAKAMHEIVTKNRNHEVMGDYSIAESYGFDDDEAIELREAIEAVERSAD